MAFDWTRSLLPTVATGCLLLGACVGDPMGADVCQPGTRVDTPDAALCVFEHPVIIETGFDCPAEYPYLFVIDGASVCSDSPDVPPDVLDALLPLGPENGSEALPTEESPLPAETESEEPTGDDAPAEGDTDGPGASDGDPGNGNENTNGGGNGNGSGQGRGEENRANPDPPGPPDGPPGQDKQDDDDDDGDDDDDDDD